jgi:hypothetical protein
MKEVALSDVKDDLSNYLRLAEKEEIPFYVAERTASISSGHTGTHRRRAVYNRRPSR